MPNIFTTDHSPQLAALRGVWRPLSAALVPLFASRYHDWLSTMTTEAVVGQVSISRFRELLPEQAGAAVLRRVLLSCAEHYPKPIPMHGVSVRTGLDVVETTDDTIDYLEDLGAKLIELLIESTELVIVEERDNGKKTLRMHPVWARRLFGAARLRLA